ncbi:hypothetical protein ACIBK9_47110 [Nonomuraea sp. NPDC050227]|uniref:hypothetical protein n=1 Tax=Nonomuraea sp. NPDC050227 TaxID=3364360 RepID=UPI00379DAE16
MIPVAPSTPHTDAVVEAIAAIPMLVDRAKLPSGAGWQGTPGSSSFVRYAVVYPFPGTPEGNTAEPYEYLNYQAQISIFGATATQAERGFDDVNAALIGRRLDVAGRSTYPVQAPPGQRPLRRDDSLPTPVYMAVVEIQFKSQPA